MSAQIVQLQRLFRRNWDWSPPELAEFYRVEFRTHPGGTQY